MFSSYSTVGLGAAVRENVKGGVALRTAWRKEDEKQKRPSWRHEAKQKDTWQCGASQTGADRKRPRGNVAKVTNLALEVEEGKVEKEDVFVWHVFWDIENVRVPRGVQGRRVVHSIRARLQEMRRGPVVRILAVGNVLSIPYGLRTDLQANGVTLVHVDNRRKDAADKMLIAEMCLLTTERVDGVVLISGDVDFAHALGRLRLRGAMTGVVATQKCARILGGVVDFTWGLREDVLRMEREEAVNREAEVRTERIQRFNRRGRGRRVSVRVNGELRDRNVDTILLPCAVCFWVVCMVLAAQGAFGSFHDYGAVEAIIGSTMLLGYIVARTSRAWPGRGVSAMVGGATKRT